MVNTVHSVVHVKGVSYWLTKKFVACIPVCFIVVVVVVSFSFPFFHRCSFFTLLASISHFLTAAIKFSCCSSSEIRPLCFYLSR